MGQTSTLRALEIAEIRRMILMQVQNPRDLARCALVNRMWHEDSLAFLWKGQPPARWKSGVTVKLSALAALVDDESRFAYYVRHLRHFAHHLGRHEIYTDDGSLDQTPYTKILRADLWKSIPLQSLALTMYFRRDSQPPCPLPIPLLQHRLRVLKLVDFQITEELCLLSKSLSLQGLYLGFNHTSLDQALLTRLVQSQQSLSALELRFDYMYDYWDSLATLNGSLLSQIARLPNLRHFGHFQDEIKRHPPLKLPSQSLKRLESLELDDSAVWGAFLKLKSPPPLRRILMHSASTDNDANRILGPKFSDFLTQLSRIPTLEEADLYHVVHGDDADDDDDASVQTALHKFAEACPALRILKLDFTRNPTLSSISLIHVTDCCAQLTQLRWDSPVEDGAVHLVTRTLKSLPRLIDFQLNISCNLLEMTQLLPLDIPMQSEIRSLRLLFLSFGYAEDVDDEICRSVLDVLATRLPLLKDLPLRTIDTETMTVFREDLGKLLGARPEVKTPQSMVLEDIDASLLT